MYPSFPDQARRGSTCGISACVCHFHLVAPLIFARYRSVYRTRICSMDTTVDTRSIRLRYTFDTLRYKLWRKCTPIHGEKGTASNAVGALDWNIRHRIRIGRRIHSNQGSLRVLVTQAQHTLGKLSLGVVSETAQTLKGILSHPARPVVLLLDRECSAWVICASVRSHAARVVSTVGHTDTT